MYESMITTLLILICSFLIAYISYTFGRTILAHEEKLESLSSDIDRHERDIHRIDKSLIDHIRESRMDKNTTK
jgi:uncharacterized membrane protein